MQDLYRAPLKRTYPFKIVIFHFKNVRKYLRKITEESSIIDIKREFTEVS